MSSENLATPSISTSQGNRSKIPPRERILAAARELFYTRGIRAVSVDAIAEAAATNKMTLYRHFESKDELVAEYLKGMAVELEGLWLSVAKQHPGEPDGQLRAWIDLAAAMHSADDDRGCPFANAAVEIPERDHPARAVIESTKAKYRAVLTDLCKRAGYRDYERLANEIILMFEGACIDRQSGSACGPSIRVFDMIRALVANHPKV